MSNTSATGSVGVYCLALDMIGGLRDELRRSRLATFSWLLARNAVRRVLKKTDFAEVGGAPLLGVNGVVIAAHGRSNAIAIQNAMGLALRSAQSGANQRLTERGGHKLFAYLPLS